MGYGIWDMGYMEVRAITTWRDGCILQWNEGILRQKTFSRAGGDLISVHGERGAVR